MVLAVQCGILVQLYNSLFHTTWPLAGTMLFAIAMWFAAQPFFCLGGKTILGTAVTMIPIALMAAWFTCRYKPLGGGSRDWNEISSMEVLQLLSVIVLFAWITLQCVSLARRNENLTFPRRLVRWWYWLVDTSTLFERRSTAFRSPFQAMFWYKWRWNGMALSLCMLFLLVLFLIAEPSRMGSLRGLASALNAALAGTMVPGVCLGILQGFQLDLMQVSPVSGRSASRLSDLDYLGSYQATRPVTDSALARSSLWVCLGSIGLLVGVWSIFMLPVVFVAALGQQMDQLSTLDPGWIAVPFTVLFLWIVCSNFIAIVSTGRTKLFSMLFIAALFLYLGVLFTVQWTVSSQVQQRLYQVCWILIASALLIFSLWAFARAVRSEMIRAREVAVVTLVAVGVIALVWLSLRQIDSTSIALIVCVGLLSILPWATTPLAIRWNRHR